MAIGRVEDFSSFIAVVFLLFVTLSENVKCLNMFGYGPFRSTLEEYSLCNEPIRKNAVDVNVNATIYLKNGHVLLDATFSSNRDITSTVQARVRYWKWSGKRFELSFTNNIPNVCMYKNMTRLITEKIDFIDPKTCYVRKGSCIVRNANVNEITDVFLGERFFYGRFKTRTTYFTAKEKILCYTIVQHIFDVKHLNAELKQYAEYVLSNNTKIVGTIIHDGLV